MDKFSEAYYKARSVLSGQKFEAGWEKFLKTEIDVLTLLGADGPNQGRADDLDKIRKKIADSTKNGAFKSFFVGGGTPDALLAAAKNDTSPGSAAERAATLKLLKHLYFSRKRGGQEVWVYAGPKSYSAWVYDEIKGAESAYKSKLGAETEVYSAKQREAMCDALQLALTWSQKVAAGMANKDEKAKQAVRAWFADETTTDAQIDSAMTKLNDGFKKIAGVCNGARLVLSDHPPDRSKGGWKDWAFVYKSEAMDVVYLQGAYLKAAKRTGTLWKCALTIIHELSHREVKTDDNRYDYDGLKPDKSSFPHAKALDNADSWAYFALDFVGTLPAGDRKDVLA
jgi:hypothetical protein